MRGMRVFLLIIGLIHVQNAFTQKMVSIENLKQGDFVFFGKSSSHLSTAIHEVTQTNMGTEYSHVGLLEFQNDTLYLLHAGGENGCEKIPFEKYLNKKNRNPIVDVYRVQDGYFVDWQAVMQRAEKWLGLPYNHSYILNDTSLYCSDFVYRVIQDTAIFQLNPMTFKSPNQETYHPLWVSYYERLGVDIPEGLPGCNPNGMATSSKIIWVGRLLQQK